MVLTPGGPIRISGMGIARLGKATFRNKINLLSSTFCIWSIRYCCACKSRFQDKPKRQIPLSRSPKEIDRFSPLKGDLSYNFNDHLYCCLECHPATWTVLPVFQRAAGDYKKSARCNYTSGTPSRQSFSVFRIPAMMIS